MDKTIIYYALIVVAFYAAWFWYIKNAKQKQQELLQNTDLNKELDRAESYVSEKLNGDCSFLKKQMGGKSIDAFSYASVKFTNKDSFKAGVKDSLRGMATLGTVRFTTVRTPKYLVLSGSELHLFDTDKEGNISEHLIFNSDRLSQSTLEETPLSKVAKAYNKGTDGKIKSYKISLATDADSIELEFLSTLKFNDTTIDDGSGLSFGNAAKKQLAGMIIVNDFLKQLGEKYPNLKVDLPILK